MPRTAIWAGSVVRYPDLARYRAQYWCDQWRAALSNMPKKSPRALCHCLGIQARTQRAGTVINNRLTHSRKPRNPAVRARLLKYAGPQGATLAIMRLTTLGLMHRYR